MQILGCCGEDGSYCLWNYETSEKIVEYQVNSFLNQIQVLDPFTVFAVGSGPNLMKIKKNDGKITKKIPIGGSHINCFDFIKLGESRSIYFIGGEN